MSKQAKTPLDTVERERASDVPEGAELRADGSYIDKDASKVQADLREQEVQASEDEEAQRDKLEGNLAREEGAQSEMPRETGTNVDGA